MLSTRTRPRAHELLRTTLESQPLANHGVATSRPGSCTRIETSVHAHFEGKRLKHWLDDNSLKLYTHANVLRTETTINNADQIQVLRPAADDPDGPLDLRRMRRTVVDLPQRATYSHNVNERYLEALATTAETRTVRELTEPLTQRVAEPRTRPGQTARYVRGLNPLAAADAQLLTAVSDPKVAASWFKESRPCDSSVPHYDNRSTGTASPLRPGDPATPLADASG